MTPRNRKIAIIVVVGLAVACAVGGVVILTWDLQPQAVQPVATAEPKADPLRPAPQQPPVALEQQPVEPVAEPVVLTPVPAKAEAPRPQRPKIPQEVAVLEPVIPYPLAREALSLVGADPDAAEIWFAAINDPTLTPNQRQDLIEDLNEEGFPDPKHITADDLPLIVNRIQIIEELAADAMDEVNEAAFAEAYKDLVNMLARLVGG